VPNFGHE
jgi:hypothetical protein